MSGELPEAARERVALCMIVRDEEDVLGRCLASVRGLVGEMIVVDTGSRDGTAAVAERFGARVLSFPWCDDFAAARNVALEAASRPWALVLDADEELVVDDAAALERAVMDERLAGYQLELRNVLDGGRHTDCRVFRLLRRDRPGMRYRGQLHEQVIAVAEERAESGRLEGARILHYGYASERAARKEKGPRNLRLATALVASRSEDPFAWFSLGAEQADLKERVASYRRALELLAASGRDGAREDYVLHLHVDLCKAHRRLGDEEEAERVAGRGLALHPRSPDLHFLRGQLRLARHDAAGAASDLARCLPVAGDPFSVVVSPAIVAYEGRALLGAALARLGRRDEAIAHLEQAAAAAPPEDATAHRLLGALRLEAGHAAEALSALRVAVESAPADGAARLLLGRALLAAGEHAAGWETICCAAAFPEGRELLQRNIAALLERSPAEARRALAAWHEAHPGRADACYWLGYGALEDGAVEEAERWWREAVARAPEHALAKEGLRLLGA